MSKLERNSSVKDRSSSLIIEEPRIILTIISAKHLFAKDPNGYSDPYVVVNYGSTKFKTKAASKTVSPFWNETFILDIESLTGDLDIQVWHKDTSKFVQEMKDEDFIGHVIIPLNTLSTAPIQCGHFKLLPKNPDALIKELGSVAINLTHTTNKEIELKNPSDKKAREDFYCGYMTKLGGRGVLQNWKKRWFVLQRSKLSYFESETTKEAIFSIDLEKDVEKLYMENPNKFSFSLETKVQGNRTFLIMAESDKMMAKWMTLIDGVKYFCVNSKKFLSSMDPTLKKTLLTQLYFKNIKGGSIKFFRNTGSDPNKGFHHYEVSEQWEYAPEGTLTCSLGPFNGLSYKWDGQSLRVYDNKNRSANLTINRNIIAGHGFWDGFRLGWCDSAGDIVEPFNYYYDGYQFVNTNVLKYSCSRLINLFTVELMTELNGHWFYTGEVPEPVVMFIIIIKLMHPDQFKKAENSLTDSNNNNNKLQSSASTGNINTAVTVTPESKDRAASTQALQTPAKEEFKRATPSTAPSNQNAPRPASPQPTKVEEPKKEEPKKEEPKKEEVKKEEPKKEEPKKEEPKKEEPKKEEVKKEEVKKEEPKKEEPKKEEPKPQENANGAPRRKMSMLEDSDEESSAPPSRPAPTQPASEQKSSGQTSSSSKEDESKDSRGGTMTGQPRRKMSLIEDSDEEPASVSRNSSESIESNGESSQNSSNSQLQQPRRKMSLLDESDEEQTSDQKSTPKEGSSSAASSTRKETPQQQPTATDSSASSATTSAQQRRPSNWITAKVRMEQFEQQ